MTKLEIDSVTLSFEGRSILSNVYLKCEQGEIIGLLGRNGSGKSCLLKVIFGTLKAESQSVRLGGNHVEQLYRVHGAVHFVPQDGLFMPYLTFMDLSNIFNLEPKLDQLMEVEELERFRNVNIGSLSGGIRKLVEIFTLLYAESSFLLLDEPFSFLSPVLVEKIIPHIKRQSKVKGIIMTDHQYNTIWSTSNKHYMLHEGSLQRIYEQGELEKYGYVPLTNNPD